MELRKVMMMTAILTGCGMLVAGFVGGWVLARRVDIQHQSELWRVSKGMTPVIPKSYGNGEPEETK